MLRILAAAAAVTVKEESAIDVDPPEVEALPNAVDWDVMTRVVTLSSRRSSFKALTILSSVSLITTSDE